MNDRSGSKQVGVRRAVHSGGGQGRCPRSRGREALRGLPGVGEAVAVAWPEGRRPRGRSERQGARAKARVRICAHVRANKRESAGSAGGADLGWRKVAVIFTCLTQVVPCPDVVDGEVAGPRGSTRVPERRGVRHLSTLQVQACFKARSATALTRFAGTSRFCVLL